MKSIGLQELQENLSRTIEDVERGEVVEITRHGRTVARVVPVDLDPSPEERRAILDDLSSLAAELGRHTRTSNVAETISKQRR